jgi:hypothetical protein
VEEEQRKYRKYYNMKYIAEGDMNLETAMTVLDLRNPPLASMRTARWAWERAVLPAYPEDDDHPVEKIQAMNKARDALFSVMTYEKIRINEWIDTMTPKLVMPMAEQSDESLTGEVESVKHLDNVLIRETGPPLAEQPVIEQLNEQVDGALPDDGRLSWGERMMAQQMTIKRIQHDLSIAEQNVKDIKKNLSNAKQVFEDMLETNRGSKRSKEDANDEMSEESSEMGEKTSKTGFQCHRKHRRSNENKELVRLFTDIERFVADEFEEKRGAHVLCNELYAMFRRSSGERSEFEQNVFKKHIGAEIKKQWPNHKYGRFQNIRCYFHISAKPQ